MITSFLDLVVLAQDLLNQPGCSEHPQKRLSRAFERIRDQSAEGITRSDMDNLATELLELLAQEPDFFTSTSVAVAAAA